MNKNINEMTRKEFEALPHREWNEQIKFNSMIILPDKVNKRHIILHNIRCWIARKFYLNEPEAYEVPGIHDSGFRCLDFVAVRDNTPICLLSGCSDVIHIDGIGGYGNNWLKRYGIVPNLVPTTGWSIDCLSVSGLLRIWPNASNMTCGTALSSFEIYSLEKTDE